MKHITFITLLTAIVISFPTTITAQKKEAPERKGFDNHIAIDAELYGNVERYKVWSYNVKTRRNGTPKEKLSYKNSAEFNDKGDAIKIKTDFFGKERYQYNDKAELVMIKYSSNHYCKKEYDSIGNLIKETYKNGKYFHETIYKYDSKGNLIEWAQYDEEGKETSRSEYIYDSNGNEIECNRYKDGVLNSKTTSKYDSEGNKIEELYKSYDESKPSVRVKRTEIKYRQ